MRVIITGGLGFLGSRLVAAVLSRGFEVIAPIRIESINKIPADNVASAGLKWWPIPVDNLGQVLDGLPPAEVIIHCATNYGRGEDGLRKVLESNIVFPLALLEHSRKFGLRHFINIDSYFNKPQKEFSSLLNYSMSKRSFLFWLASVSQDLQVTNLRLEHMYGPGDGAHKFIPTVIQRVAVDKVKHFDLTMGHQTRDFIYVDDVVDAVVLTLLRGSREAKAGDKRVSGMQTFEIGTGVATSVARLVNTVANASSSPTELRFGAIPSRQDEVWDSKADGLFQTEFNWEHKINLEEGIRAILEAG